MTSMMLFVVGWACLVLCCIASSDAQRPHHADDDNIHAVIVSSSRYWFNYRHANNALAIVNLLTSNGVSQDRITLMLADEYPANPRNKYKNGMYAHGVHPAGPTLYNETTRIDYRGADVTVQYFLDVLLGIEGSSLSSSHDDGSMTVRQGAIDDDTVNDDDLNTISATTRPPSVLRSNAESNVLVYITGHGGDQFFKFQDEEEITSLDLSRVFDQLYARGKFKQLLFMADTCQAFTLADEIETPNVISIGSSLREENAYAHHSDSDLGLSVMERYTYGFTEYYKNKGTAQSTIYDILLQPFGWSADPSKQDRRKLGAHVGLKQEHSTRKVHEILFSEFFGSPPSGKLVKGQQERGGYSTSSSRFGDDLPDVTWTSASDQEDVVIAVK